MVGKCRAVHRQSHTTTRYPLTPTVCGSLKTHSGRQTDRQTHRQTIIQHMHCTTYRCGHTGTHAHPHPRSHIQLHIRTYIYTSVRMYVHIRCLLHMLSALALHTTNLYNCLGAKVSVRLYKGVPQCTLNVRWELLVPHYVAQQVGC